MPIYVKVVYPRFNTDLEHDIYGALNEKHLDRMLVAWPSAAEPPGYYQEVHDANRGAGVALDDRLSCGFFIFEAENPKPKTPRDYMHSVIIGDVRPFRQLAYDSEERAYILSQAPDDLYSYVIYPRGEKEMSGESLVIYADGKSPELVIRPSDRKMIRNSDINHGEEKRAVLRVAGRTNGRARFTLNAFGVYL